MHPADQLIVEIAQTGRAVGDEELGQILPHVAAAGFDPNALEHVRGRLVGSAWRGKRITRGREMLPPAEVKYLWHALKQQEWPTGTTLNKYIESIRQVILDASSGILVNRQRDVWELGIVRETRELRGPGGYDWVLVQYRPTRGHWVTAFQPALGLAELERPGWSDVRWLRQPKHRNGP